MTDAELEEYLSENGFPEHIRRAGRLGLLARWSAWTPKPGRRTSACAGCSRPRKIESGRAAPASPSGISDIRRTPPGICSTT